MRHYWIFSLFIFAILSGCSQKEETGKNEPYAGSSSCIKCHKPFYQRWVTSHHGTAMQPVTDEFVKKNLTQLSKPMKIQGKTYQVDLAKRTVIEKDENSSHTYPMNHVLGGKNVFYFLTYLQRGKLQTLPVAYNTVTNGWFHTQESMVRHFLPVQDSALDWKDSMLTFNTSCFGCHVSQLEKNYDRHTDSYATRWREAGISCESCHGPSSEHVKFFTKHPDVKVAPEKLHLASWRTFTPEQQNHACAICHAKMRPLTNAFEPGDNYFDHYDLTCFEDPDFSADGRDLGENYTYTLWLLNPCSKKSGLNCVTCHTSSGRYRFALSVTNAPNDACVTCHSDKRGDKAFTAHSRHPAKLADGKPNTCLKCHAPMTRFAAMRRCDHSFRPPCPEASGKFGSTSACILCHKNQKESWAAGHIQKWFPDSKRRQRYLKYSSWIAGARTNDWSKLPEISVYLKSTNSNPALATSLLRMLPVSGLEERFDIFRSAAKHPHPLVRSAAMLGLSDDLEEGESRAILAQGLVDPIRLVRLSSVQSLATFPEEMFDEKTLVNFRAAEKELFESFETRPDAWSAAYNRGLYYNRKGKNKEALEEYLRAIRLRPDVMPPRLNASVLLSQQNRLQEACEQLEAAAKIDPASGVVQFNLGLALAELGQPKRAEQALREALKCPATRSQAAFNCAVLIFRENLPEAKKLLGIALEEEPNNQRYLETKQYFDQMKQ